MRCPYCQNPLLEDSPACPGCGLTMEKADAFFVTVPKLARGISDPGGVLRTGSVRRMRQAIRRFESVFPQLEYSAAFMDLPSGTPGPAYTCWVFNRSFPETAHDVCRRIFLLVDTGGGGAWLTAGYGLEPFLGAHHLRQCLDRAGPLLTARDFAAGVCTLLEELETVCRGILAALPRTFGLAAPGPSGESSPSGA